MARYEHPTPAAIDEKKERHRISLSEYALWVAFFSKDGYLDRPKRGDLARFLLTQIQGYTETGGPFYPLEDGEDWFEIINEEERRMLWVLIFCWLRDYGL